MRRDELTDSTEGARAGFWPLILYDWGHEQRRYDSKSSYFHRISVGGEKTSGYIKCPPNVVVSLHVRQSKYDDS